MARYMLLCIGLTAVLCLAVMISLERVRNRLDERYDNLYFRENYQTAYLVDSQGNVLSSTPVGIGLFDDDVVVPIRPITDYMTPGDKMLYRVLQIYPFFLPLCFAAAVAVTSALFYSRRLKKPLAALDAAAGRIAAGDLDFRVEVPGSDELARLGASFETMRAALAETSRTLWRTLEEERRMQAAFAHDLRTPLTVLRGYDEFLLRYADVLPPEKLRDTLRTVHGSLDRLERYAARMSRVRRLEELTPAPAPVDLAALGRALQADGRALCGGLEFALEGCAGTLCLDEALVREVFENLAANAARHAAHAVSVRLTAGAQALTLTVQDDGPGFGPAALVHAAEPFWRDDGGARDAAHFGLGLYVCRLLCEKHGGRLRLANGPQGGAQAAAVFAALPPAGIGS